MLNPKQLKRIREILKSHFNSLVFSVIDSTNFLTYSVLSVKYSDG